MADQVSGRLSPFLRKARISAALPHLAGAVLDFGCGVGALAGFIPPDRYTGADSDAESLERARVLHPSHGFYHPPELGALGRTFDSIALLAVLEHVADRAEFLATLGTFLAPRGRIVITTPHPVSDSVHRAGSRLGLFSREAGEEHGSLISGVEMGRLARGAGFTLALRRRFLLGMNQLFILEKA